MMISQGCEPPDFSAQCDAWKEFRKAGGNVSIDRMVCEPLLRERYLSILRRKRPDADEGAALWSLMNARKNKTLRQRLAE